MVPALSYHENKKELVILDICFGLGYNSLSTLYYIKKKKLNKKIHIYSPELDKDLIESLKDFAYPKEFEEFTSIIDSLSNKLYYEDEMCKIELFNKDAREALKDLIEDQIKFDIVFQDPFSSEVNRSLWTVEYFGDIVKLLNRDAIVTTYSVATPVRLSMFENGLEIYEIKAENKKKSTVAFMEKQNGPQYKYIDMELKKQRNQNAAALKDKE